MTKNDLIQLSKQTFFDNDEGRITPDTHRDYNRNIIDSVALDSGWTQVRKTAGIGGDGKYEIDWCVMGDSLILTGVFDSGQYGGAASFDVDIPERYLERINGDFTTLADVALNSDVVTRRAIIAKVVGNSLNIAPDYGGQIIGVRSLEIFLSPLIVIPLEPEEIKGDIVDQQSGIEYGEWDYSEIAQTNNRTRTATPYTQGIYENGSLAEKVYGESTVEVDEAVRSYSHIIIYPNVDERSRYGTRWRYLFEGGDEYAAPLDEIEVSGMEFYITQSNPLEPFSHEGGVYNLADKSVCRLMTTTGIEPVEVDLSDPNIEIRGVVLMGGSDELPDYVYLVSRHKGVFISDYSTTLTPALELLLRLQLYLSPTVQYNEEGEVTVEIVGEGEVKTYGHDMHPTISYLRIPIAENLITAFSMVTSNWISEMPSSLSPASVSGPIKLGFDTGSILQISYSSGKNRTFTSGIDEYIPGVYFDLTTSESWLTIATNKGMSYMGYFNMAIRVSENNTGLQREAPIYFQANCEEGYGEVTTTLTTATVIQRGS